MKRMMLCALAMFATAFLSAFADWTWAGKSGNITIPAGTTATVTDGDVATVAALTGIEIESGAELAFANTGVRCVLAATLTGDGALNVGDGGMVTFAGNSPAYTGEMHFLNSKICVTHSNALGSGKKGDGTTQRFVYSDGSYHSSARKNADGLCFADGVACEPGIAWYGDRSNNKRDGKNVTWFSEKMSDHVTFNGPLEMNKNGNVDWILIGNYTFNAGCGVRVVGKTVMGSPQYQVANDCKAYVNGAKSLSGFGTSYCAVSATARSELHLNAPGDTMLGSVTLSGSGKIICESENALPASSCNLGRNNEKSGNIDLNGKDQTVGKIKHCTDQGPSSTWPWTPTEGEQSFVTVTSSADATLTATEEYSALLACEFRDRASLAKTGGGTLTLVNRYSDTKGTLSVSAGEVRFDWGAGWGGDLDLSGEGRMTFLPGTSLNKLRESEVAIANGAKLVLSNGVKLVCSKLSLGGAVMGVGTYSKATHPDYFDGEGEIDALASYQDTYTWKDVTVTSGWGVPENWEPSGVPGADSRAILPNGCFVNILDEDVGAIEATGLIKIMDGASLNFLNTQARCTLTASVIGNGALNTGDGVPVTFAGDSRGFTGPMVFDRSKIVVTSRYGLGDAYNLNGTRRYVRSDGSYHATARPNAEGLRFRGDGLSCDAGIYWFGVRNTEVTRFTDAVTDQMVFNGPVEMNKTSNVDEMTLGNYTFMAGLGVREDGNYGTPSYTVATGCKAYIRGSKSIRGAVNSFYSTLNVGSDAELHLDTDGATISCLTLCGKGRIVCDATNMLSTTEVCNFGHGDRKWDWGTIDLNGHDQAIPRFAHSSKWTWTAVKGEPYFVTVTSGVPAKVVMTSDTSTDAFTCKFTGQASLAKTGKAPFFRFVNQYSDTTGALSVSKGEVRFDWGAGWGGDIALSGTGKAVFMEPCPKNRPSNAVGAVTLADTAKLVVSNGVRYCCAKLAVNGKELGAGTYTAATLPDWIEGGGSVCVGKPGILMIVR